jgi:hypothetical protein
VKKKSRKRSAADKNAALFWEAGKLWMGSSEVIMRRMGMFGKALDGRTPLPYAEITRMWHEKFVAGLNLYMSLGVAPLAVMPTLFRNRNNANVAAVLLEQQVDIVAKALKPVSRVVRANKKRMSKR